MNNYYTLGCISYFWLSAPDTTFSPVFIQKCIIKYMFLLTKVNFKVLSNVSETLSVNERNTCIVTLINSINSVVFQFVVGSLRIRSGKDLVLSGSLFLMVTYSTIVSKHKPGHPQKKCTMIYTEPVEPPFLTTLFTKQELRILSNTFSTFLTVWVNPN